MSFKLRHFMMAATKQVQRLSVSAILFFILNISSAASIEGVVTHFVDGDSLKIWKQSIRLIDIDTPEIAQNCINSRGKSYACGIESSNVLKKIIGDNELRCVGDKVDRYKRLLATCYVGNLNVNRELVLRGWAVNYRSSKEYAAEQQQAQTSKRGLWAGEFLEPIKFRQRSKAYDPKAEQSQSFKPNRNNAKNSDSSKCNIKGNISSSGKIYHTPWGSRSYNKTKINTARGERWFCSEQEAEAAGWRAARR